jgi:hypothetical protein
VVLPIISRFGCRGGFQVRTSLKVGNLATTIIGGEGCLKGLVGCDGLVITARTAPPRVERKGNVWVESWTPALVLRCFRTSTRCCLKGTPLTSLSCVASPYCWRPFPPCALFRSPHGEWLGAATKEHKRRPRPMSTCMLIHTYGCCPVPSDEVTTLRSFHGQWSRRCSWLLTYCSVSLLGVDAVSTYEMSID